MRPSLCIALWQMVNSLFYNGPDQGRPFFRFEVEMKNKPLQWVLAAGFFSLALAAGDLRLRVARKLADQGQWTQAMQEVRMHLAEHPESTEGYVVHGQLLLEQDKKQEAAESFKQALTQDPQNKSALAGLAQARGKALPNETAAPKAVAKANPAPTEKKPGISSTKDLPPAAPSDPKYEDKEFKAAIEDYRLGKKAEAQKKLRQVLARHPKHAGAYYLGGVIRYESGEFDKAAYNFKRALDYPERGYNAHFYLGRIYQKVGRNEDAIRELESYVKMTPSDDGKTRAENLLAELRQAQSGAKPSPSVAAAKPDHAEPTGDAEALKKPESPSAAAHGEITTQPTAKNLAPIHATPPDSLHGQPEPPVGKTAQVGVLPMEDGFLFLISDSASNGGRKLMLAHALYRRDRLEQTVQTLKELIRDYPGTENADVARLNLAAVYLRMQLWQDAQNQLEAFAEQAPESRHKYFDLAHFLLGRAYLGEGKPAGLEKAEAYFSKVKADGPFGPTLAEKSWHMALLGEKLPDPAKRGESYQTALGYHPAGPRHIYLQWKFGLHEAQFGKTGIALAHFDAAHQACGQTPATDSIAAWCADAQVRAADMAFRQRDWSGAMGRYQKFAKDKPKAADAPWAQYQIGNVHKAQARYDLALNAYQKVIDNFPESYWAAQAKWQREDAIWQKEFAEVLD
jgi:tetratricopeptide (TPR) repeat protein